MKISKKINDINSRVDSPTSSGTIASKTFYSFEYFPPKTQQGVENLLERIERMGQTNPLWIDVTWNAGGVTSDITLDLCSHIQNYCGMDVLMHLTCTYMTREKVKESLDKAKELGIKNLLALRGDPPRGATDWVTQENGFNYASDLVSFIKEEYGDYFCIGVAGYPEIHLQATSREDDIRYLKLKVDAGADFVITQLFFDNQIFYNWVAECRQAGIECEIIPGIMPILGYDRFHRMCKFTKTQVPEHILQRLEELKGDDQAVQAYGVEYGITQTTDLINRGYKFIHYYTMNLESSVIKMLQGNGTLDKQRSLPFRTMTNEVRSEEQVRPIFWAIKPKSYVSQTQTWDDFPNGRWGSSDSPAFQLQSDEGFISFTKKQSSDPAAKRGFWGEEVLTVAAIADIFTKYVQGTLKKFPFSEGKISAESELIKDALVCLNKNKLFTINSQPAVNGVPSSDPIFGWGPAKGYIYQKAYFEFFVPQELIMPLVEHLNQYETLSYQALNKAGNQIQNIDADDEHINAVTWGIFPNREVIQPTVVDQKAFRLWKEEAFEAWLDKWAYIYEEESPSRAFLKNVHDTFYLVNVVENDYIGGNLSAILMGFIDKYQELTQSIQ